MNRTLIKYTPARTNHKAFTLAEILVAIVIAVSLIGAVVSFYVLANRTYSFGANKQWLQDDANSMLTRIIEGKLEPGGVYRLCEAISYDVVSLSELHFTGTDGVERWFKLNGTSTSLIYHHPTAAGTTDETIYTAPSGAVITLRFSIPVGAQYTGVVIGIDAALAKTISGRRVCGSASTYVNIRNHNIQ